MKIGILGTGNIVRNITATLKGMSNMKCYAIASRTMERAAEAAQCIAAGKIESDSMPLGDSITVMEVMDGLRAQWGLKYPQEK